MMSNEGEMRCPLCAEDMDWTDQQLKPCKCDYQVCVWCWHQIMDMAEKDETEGRCPACRSPYDKDKIVGAEAKFERVAANNASRKHKPPKAKAKTNELKDLTNIRVIQRRMVYVIGMPLNLCEEDLLQRKEFFGQYGKVCKVSLSRTAGGVIQQFINDTSSVYVTFSKEEEAVRCIQSVHGFVLEGRFLRASFGTAKYCHAWLKNMPCNNASCLYLHNLGAEEDCFSKDEVAAVQTRSRVQQIVGTTHNIHRSSGNVLPPPIDEHLSQCSASDKPIFKSSLMDVALDSKKLNGHLTSLPSPEDKDEGASAPNKMTTFVDIVGQPYSSNGPEKDGNVAEDKRNLKGSSESLIGIHKENYVQAAVSDGIRCQKVSSSNQLGNGFPTTNKAFQEPFRQQLNHWGDQKAGTTSSYAFIKEQSGLALDSGEQIQRGPCSVLRDNCISFNDRRSSDARSITQAAPLLSPSYPLKVSEDCRNFAWQHEETHDRSNHIVGLDTVNNNVDLASVGYANSANEGYNAKKFQCSAKSDRIYRCSNSFSSEEIVEHLRRLDDHDGTKEAQSPSFQAVESSIISNILSLDLDDGNDSWILNHSPPGLFDHTDRHYGSAWDLSDSNQSRSSFTKQQSFGHQLSNLDSFSDISHGLKGNYVPPDSGENKNYSCKPQYPASMSQGPSPTGFSLPSREPPPGFSASGRTDQNLNTYSGAQMVKTPSFTKNHYRTPSTGNSSNTSDVDIIDPAILVVGRGKPSNGLMNSCFDTRSSYASQSGTLDDEARLWLLLQQQSSPAHQNLKYPQTYVHQQTPAARQEQRCSGGQTGNGYSSWDDMYGISSTYVEKPLTHDPPSYTTFSQQKVAIGNYSNCYQQDLDVVQLRNQLGMAELQRNERLGLNNFYSGYGDYVLQQPGSGDLYARVFGM